MTVIITISAMLFSGWSIENVRGAFEPEITDVHHIPRYPIGSTEFEPPNGDKINVYATVTDPDGISYVNITYYYCDYSMCYPPVTKPMDYLGNDQYSKTLTYGTINGTYLPGWKVYYYINATDSQGDSSQTQEYDFTLLWPPSSMTVIEELSQESCYWLDAIWVNGTATYDENESAPFNSSAPVDTSNVTIRIDNDTWYGKTNATGFYSIQIIAPSVEGIYNVNVTVDNSTRSIIGYNESTLTVDPLIITAVTETLDPTTCYPNEEVWVNGSAVYNSGKPVAMSDVNVTIVESGMWWTSATDLDGDYSVNITAPAAPNTYTINVTITNTTNDLQGYNETYLIVSEVPVPDLVLSQEDITFSKDYPLEGDIIVINAVVHNQGTENVTNALVNFSLDYLGNWFGSDEISINVGGSDVASATWTSVAGNHTIWVVVDPLDAIVEANENNNNASKNIFVDKDTDGDGIGDTIDEDDDNDGYNDTVEMSEGSDPLDNYSMPADVDGDYIPDSIDPDIDDDEVPNEDDAFPFDANETVDTDGDGIGNNGDEDDDGDGYLDEIDPYPLDTDNDGLSNDIDDDDDGDGILDVDDAYPFDTDNDGSRNDVDEDDDNDGLLDVEEDKNWNGIVDEGETNPLKWDTDGDGVNDKEDAFPLNPGKWSEDFCPLCPHSILLYVAVIVAVCAVLFIIVRQRKRVKK